MDIMELGAIGELVGGVAVIATLIYLALQVGQSTTATRGAAERELLEGVQRINERIAQHAPMFRQGLASFDNMSNDDKLVFASLFNTFMNHLEQALRMHARGLLTADNVDVLGDICLTVLQEPGGGQIWERTKTLYFSMSRDYVQRRLDADCDLPPRVSELMPWWGPGEGQEA